MSADKIKKLFGDLSAEQQATLLFDLYKLSKQIDPLTPQDDTSVISRYAAKHQKEYQKDITFDVEKRADSNLISVTLHTVYGKFKAVGTNQKIAKVNAVKQADECWGNG